MSKRTPCIFCHREVPLTKEHLLSNPVCRALGIERSTTTRASLDGPDLTVERLVPLEATLVKMACKECNQGWMGDLENDVAKVLRGWVEQGQPLSERSLATLERWLLKSWFVSAAMHAGTRNPFDGSTYTARVLFVPSQARALMLGDPAATQAAMFGAAQLEEVGHLVDSFGNPEVLSDEYNSIAAGVLGFNLGTAQLWTVVSPLGGRVHLPNRVTQLRPGMRLAQLPRRSGLPDPGSVTVDLRAA